MKTITVDGVTYEPIEAKPGKRAVVVVDRGWIFAGDVTEKDGRIRLTRARRVVLDGGSDHSRLRAS